MRPMGMTDVLLARSAVRGAWRSRAAKISRFTGSRSELEDYLALDLYIGVTGWVNDERRGQDLRAAVPHIPGDKLMLETDAPYLLPRDLAPQPKSRRNEPSFLPHIARTVAQLRGESPDTVAASTTRNATLFFHLHSPRQESHSAVVGDQRLG